VPLPKRRKGGKAGELRASATCPRAKRRGGQPRNSNARTHGMYSSMHPSRLTRIYGRLSILSILARMPAAVDTPTSAPLLAALRRLQASVSSIFEQAAAQDNLPLLLASTNLTTRISRLIFRLFRSRQPPFADLEKAALLSFPLTLWNFSTYYGIVRDADIDYSKSAASHSFRENSQKSGHKTRAPDDCDWFTNRQWRLIAPLLPGDPVEPHRGRPPVSSRAVVGAIFWKLAHGAAWGDLPESFPSQRTCRRLYRRWFLSGRLMTIYKVLMRDLLTRGRVHPFDLAQAGYLELASDLRIRLTSACPDTWQTRTALLFMQQSYALIRRIRREEKVPLFPGHGLLAALSRRGRVGRLRNLAPSPLAAGPAGRQGAEGWPVPEWSTQGGEVRLQGSAPTGRLTPLSFAGIKTP
jgi:transposase